MKLYIVVSMNLGSPQNCCVGVLQEHQPVQLRRPTKTAGATNRQKNEVRMV